jgi:short-subunit dehydrogenase
LAKFVLDDMVIRGGGKVLFTSSVAATMPSRYHAVYNASKSFVQSFAEGLHGELKGTGVTVTAMPRIPHVPTDRREGRSDSRATARSGAWPACDARRP